MNQTDNSILIKDTKGQFRTVNLGIPQRNNLDGLIKSKPISRIEPVKEVKTEELKNLRTEELKTEGQRSEKKEIKEPVFQPLAPEVTMPAFYFNLEDEQEVAQFRDKEQILKHGQKQKVLAYLIEKVIKKSNLSLSANIINRLKRVIDSRLHEVRDLLETKEVLIRPRELGGVGLDNNQAQNVLKIIEDKRMRIQEGIERVGIEQLTTINQQPTKKEESLEITRQKMLNEKKEVLDKVKPIATYTHPSYRKGDQIEKKFISSELSRAKIPGQVMATSQEIIPPAVKRESRVFGIKKPILSQPASQRGEAVFRPELVGPVEEMASFDLESFRQLGLTIGEAIEKIKNKIELLQDESFEKRAKGIQAWRSSPVCQNYLTLGRQSIEQGKSISQVIQDKQNKNEPTLSFEEFEAIADLNEELSY